MTSNRRSFPPLIALAAIAIALAALSLGGCKKVSEVTTPWPVAEKERETAKPPVPLVYPFTGAKAPDEKAVTKRPLSVKIENSPAARPQTGLNSADVVYESIAEGGITRFNCIFHSTVPPRVGPVRSARLSDLWIVPQYDALFFFSGASSSVDRAVNKAGLPNLSQDAGVAAPYSRSSARPAPHNLYLDTAEAYRTAKKRGHAVTSKPVPLQFTKRSEGTSQPITQVTIPFSPANTSRWTYDEKSGTYLRENNGARHFDEATGKQVAAHNVVVLWVKYKAISRDKVGSTTFDVQLGGKGKASIFRNGQKLDGTWTADRKSPPRFTDSQGRPIKLAVGRTWVQVVPLDVNISLR